VTACGSMRLVTKIALLFGLSACGSSLHNAAPASFFCDGKGFRPQASSRRLEPQRRSLQRPTSRDDERAATKREEPLPSSAAPSARSRYAFAAATDWCCAARLGGDDWTGRSGFGRRLRWRRASRSLMPVQTAWQHARRFDRWSTPLRACARLRRAKRSENAAGVRWSE